MSSITDQDPSRMSFATNVLGLEQFSLTKQLWKKDPKPQDPVSASDPENRKMDAERRRVGRGGRNATWISEAAAQPTTTGPIATLTGLKKGG